MVDTPLTVLAKEGVTGVNTSISINVNPSFDEFVSPATVMLAVNVYIPGVEKSIAEGVPTKSSG